MHAELFSRSKTLISSDERKLCAETSDPFSLSLSFICANDNEEEEKKKEEEEEEEEQHIGFSDES